MNEQTQPTYTTTPCIPFFITDSEKYKDEDPFFELPFVVRSNNHHKCWHVHPTDIIHADEALGIIYATEFMKFVAVDPDERREWLFDIIKDMAHSNKGDLETIEMAFLTQVQAVFALGIEAIMKREVA
ncbi:hypothetical protein [Desulfopila sp. IMCC35008]|uniref:hypothetical protein n=1 Tax=Desulfopila sp. IMCC35008 TaxID=2653858 RepID=UPI0013D83F32|nr:hypothetical protein [Desulfopila sp. IMCC35008]